jgi:hypothetical protein
MPVHGGSPVELLDASPDVSALVLVVELVDPLVVGSLDVAAPDVCCGSSPVLVEPADVASAMEPPHADPAATTHART